MRGRLVAIALCILGGVATGGDQSLTEREFHAYVRQLISTMSSADHKKRAEAASRLGEIGPDAKAAVAVLVKALTDTNVEVRRAASLALFRMKGSASSAVEPLLLALRGDKDAKVRARAALALSTIGDRSDSVRRGLEDALRDPSVEVREAAEESLALLRSVGGRDYE